METDIFYCIQKFSWLMYYMLISPYKLVLPPNKDDIVVEVNLIHKIVCAVNHFCQLYLTVTECYTGVKKSQGILTDPSQIYTLARLLINLINTIMFTQLTWFKKRPLQDLHKMALQFSRGSNLSRIGWIQINFPIVGLAVFPIVMELYSIMEKVVIENIPLREMYKDQIFMNLDKYLSLEENAGLELVLSIAYLLFSIYFTIFSNATVIGISTYCCLIAYKLGCECEKYLKDGPPPLMLVSSQHVELKILLRHFNSIFGLQILIFVSSLLIHFSRAFTEMLEPNMSLLIKSVNLFYFSWAGCCLVMAAVGASKLQHAFKTYLFENRRKVEYRESLEVLSLQLDLEQNPLGLQAHTFLITHGFIVTIFSQVVTYIVVLLQFASVPKKNNSTII